MFGCGHGGSSPRARAGNTSASPITHRSWAVHPRARGEHTRTKKLSYYFIVGDRIVIVEPDTLRIVFIIDA
jgi:hypothetical protein